MSYRKKHIKNKIHGARPRKSIFKKLWFWIVLLIFLVIFSVAYLVLFYPGLQVKNISIHGNQKVATNDLQAVIAKDINNKIFGLAGFNIYSKSIFLIDPEKIDKEILNNFHTIGALTASRRFPQTLDIEVVERDAAGIFCAGAEQCFMIDQNGVIYQKVISGQLDNTWTIIKQTLADENIYTGESVVSQDVIDAISKIQKDLKDNYKINLSEALISSPVRLNITTDKGWQIYFDLEKGYDISAQIKKLDLLLNGGIVAGDKKNLRYIDLRPKDKAIICDNSTCGG